MDRLLLNIDATGAAERMMSNHLRLNTAKTEALWCASSRQQHLLLSAPLCVYADDIKQGKYVRDLGIYIDSDMSMKTHVSRTVSSCFASLSHVYAASVAPSPSRSAVGRHITAMVLSRVSTTAASHSAASQSVRWVVCSQCSTRQQDWCATVANTYASHHFCATCTGYALLNA